MRLAAVQQAVAVGVCLGAVSVSGFEPDTDLRGELVVARTGYLLPLTAQLDRLGAVNVSLTGRSLVSPSADSVLAYNRVLLAPENLFPGPCLDSVPLGLNIRNIRNDYIRLCSATNNVSSAAFQPFPNGSCDPLPVSRVDEFLSDAFSMNFSAVEAAWEPPALDPNSCA